MEKRLTEAAVQGNVAELQKIVEEDPLILDKITVSCFDETPLHTAAVLGHLSFVNELLSRKPELAAEFDSYGCSPLHLAAAKGHADVVKALLLVNSEVGSARNLDGRAALHVAAIKGREAVLAELVRVDPSLTRVLTDRGETGLHLCVKWNRLEAAKYLVEEMRNDGGDAAAMNWKDCEGNSALHIAVAKKHIEMFAMEQMVKYLVKVKEVEVNGLNKNGLTALELLRQSPRDMRDMEMEQSLVNAGASTAKNLQLMSDGRVTMRRLQNKPATDWLGRKRSALMVVASLIATVAFQAGLTPPGGVWQEDYTVDDDGQPVKDPHSAGHSVMAYQEAGVYSLFMIFNTVAFLAALSIILLIVSGLPLRQRRWMWLQMVIMWVAITAQVVTYLVTLRHMSPTDVQGTLREVTEISVLSWLTLIAVVFIGNVVRVNLWVLKKYGCIKGEDGSIEEEDEQDVFE